MTVLTAAARFGGRQTGLIALLMYFGFLSVAAGFPNLYVQVWRRVSSWKRRYKSSAWVEVGRDVTIYFSYPNVQKLAPSCDSQPLQGYAQHGASSPDGYVRCMDEWMNGAMPWSMLGSVDAHLLKHDYHSVHGIALHKQSQSCRSLCHVHSSQYK